MPVSFVVSTYYYTIPVAHASFSIYNRKKEAKGYINLCLIRNCYSKGFALWPSVLQSVVHVSEVHCIFLIDFLKYIYITLIKEFFYLSFSFSFLFFLFQFPSAMCIHLIFFSSILLSNDMYLL